MGATCFQLFSTSRFCSGSSPCFFPLEVVPNATMLRRGATAAASVDQPEALDLLAGQVRSVLLGRHPPRCDERQASNQAQGGHCESGSDDTDHFAHWELHQAAGTVPEASGGMRSLRCDEKLEGEQ